MKHLTCGISPRAVALAATLGLCLTGLHRIDAAPNPTVADDSPTITLLSPAPHASFSGVKPVEVSAFYQSASNNGIVALELYIDGVKAQSKTLDVPEAKGVVSFLVDASLLTPGPHRVVVRATAIDAEVRSAKGAFVYGNDGGLPDGLTRPAPSDGQDFGPSGAAPEMRLITPAPNSKVQGTVIVQVGAADEGGRPPYVSIFIDGEFKTLVNYRPFEYEWDTSALPNGWHTIAITEAFDADVPVAHLKPIRVYVNNPGGLTSVRTDLQDAPPVAVKPVAPKSLTGTTAAPKPRTARSKVLKTAAPRPLARRPAGQALLAVPRMAAHAPQGGLMQMAKADLLWSDLHLDMSQGLSDPFVPSLSTPKAAARLVTPRSEFKPRTARAPGSPVTAAALPGGKGSQPIPKGAGRLLRMAQADPLTDDGLTSPFLALPELPAAAPKHISVTVSHPSVSPHLIGVAARARRIQIHMPHLNGGASAATARPHFALGAASLMRATGQKRVQFNSSLLQMDRPLAIHQSVLFGPLRQIFEYGGGSLQWNAQSKTVRARTSARDIRLTIGQKQATVNHKTFQMDRAPYLEEGRTMVPLSFLPAAMDVTVQYDPATNHLRITSKH